MRVSCNVIMDIIPLYLENMVSEDSKNMVEDHLQSCESCKKYYEGLLPSEPLAQDAAEMPLRKVKSILLKKRMRAAAVAVFITLIAAVILGANLTVPGYFPYSDGILTLKEKDDGSVYAVFDDTVSGYGISSYRSDDNNGYAYHIVAWDSLWDRHIMKKEAESIVLNPEGETVSAVYYYETNGSGEILLYGEQQNPCGVVIKQPQLGIAAACASLMLLLGAALTVLFRKNSGTVPHLIRISLLPASYLLSHLLVMGFSVTSYSSSRAFWRILLFTLPLYGILLLLHRLIRLRSTKNA